MPTCIIQKIQHNQSCQSRNRSYEHDYLCIKFFLSFFAQKMYSNHTLNKGKLFMLHYVLWMGAGLTHMSGLIAHALLALTDNASPGERDRLP